MKKVIYCKIVFVLFVLCMLLAFFDTSQNTGAYWVGYLVLGPLVWALPLWAVVMLYRSIFKTAA